MLYPVRIYRNDKLVEEIPSEKLFIRGEDFGGDKPIREPKQKVWVYIDCPWCGDNVKVSGSKKTCKKSVCEKLEREKRKLGKKEILKRYK